MLELYRNAGIDGLYTDSFYKVKQTLETIAEGAKRDSDLPEFFSGLELSRPSPDRQTPEPSMH
jgi:hypothetical protein